MLLSLSFYYPPLIHTQVLLESDCPVCSETDLECRVRDVLYQKDWGGDYECGSEGATFQWVQRDMQNFAFMVNVHSSWNWIQFLSVWLNVLWFLKSIVISV